MRKLLIGIIILCLLVPSVAPLSFGINIELKDEDDVYNRDTKFILLDPYSPEINIPEQNKTETSSDNIETSGSLQFEKQKEELTLSEVSNNAPLDSPWPMYCHDVRHTGRSPYSTSNNPGDEKWRYSLSNWARGSPVIDNDGIIYIGANDFYAIYPNGTLKWKYDSLTIVSSPVLDENGVIYVGTIWDTNFLYAIYTSNGTLKWKFKTGNHVHGSPAIGEDGTIYFGKDGNGSPPYSGYIMALYPNGTLKWSFKTDHFIYSSPAIGEDETVYCGSHDGNLYALYPNNGTLKWKYHTGDWVGRGACIADQGIIYFGSWDGYLYAVYPNGTLMWKKEVIFSTTPVIGQDGIIYGGLYYLYAINPVDGSTKWSFDPGPERTIRGGNPCISADGTIFFGTHIDEGEGGELIAVNPDGTERWCIMLATDWIWSAPAIGDDGTIYVGSCNDLVHPGSEGYLHAIGELDPNAPSAPTIDGPKKGVPHVLYNFTFKAISPFDRDLYYWIEWGDNKGTGWLGPYPSGQNITVGHEWLMEKTYTIKARCKDSDNLWGSWNEITMTIPRNKEVYDSLFLHFLEQFPLFKQIYSFSSLKLL